MWCTSFYYSWTADGHCRLYRVVACFTDGDPIGIQSVARSWPFERVAADPDENPMDLMNVRAQELPDEQEASQADGQATEDSAVEWPRGLSPGEKEKQIALVMNDRGVSPERVLCLLDFVSSINTPLVRLWCVRVAVALTDHHPYLLAVDVHISLSKNPLGPEGARLLGSALITNNTLQFLELDACELVGSAYRPQHAGILALSKGIQSVRSRLCYVK